MNERINESMNRLIDGLDASCDYVCVVHVGDDITGNENT